MAEERAEQQERRDEDRGIMLKKLVAWGVSFGVSLVISFLIVMGLGTDLETFSIKYFVIMLLSFMGFFIIWLDYLLGAQILPD